jgi:hypothetical protein
MDKTELVAKVSNLFRITGHKVDTSVKINHREIDVRAEETQGLVRKIILIECADYNKPVGVQKIQDDFQKLRSAKEALKDNAVIMHVSTNGYTSDASGYALENGIPAFHIQDLSNQLINFDDYVHAVENDKIRSIIIREYQPNKIYFEQSPGSSRGALTFLKKWLNSDIQWITLLGDYGVGKSWTLKRFLYELIEAYKGNPVDTPLPFYIPLQNFTKAFDFQNLILRTFQLYGLGGVYYSAFEYLMFEGKIVFLLDSFDEMAQHLSRDVIRENLKELLICLGHNSKAIMASRPNYFEGRAERLLVVEKNGTIEWHPLDKAEQARMNALSRSIRDSLAKTKFARIHDLSIEQRKKLFQIVLGKDSLAYQRLIQLLDQFQNLGNMSQRAVIARLLTTVAETLAYEKEAVTIDGVPLLPEHVQNINQAKIFEIVVHNLLHRDMNIGSLGATKRLFFLRSFALYLQRMGHSAFASPEEIRKFVQDIFNDDLRKSDMPQQLLENYYRTCRRHSGLTTEGQFRDTSGIIDMPVDELDAESRVGFSHNSLREYLVSEAFADFLENDKLYPFMDEVVISDLIGDFFICLTEYKEELINHLSNKFKNNENQKVKEILFKFIYYFIRKDRNTFISLLGKPPYISDLDISGFDLSGLPLRDGEMSNCLALDTDFRKSDLKSASFDNTILENVMFDDAVLTDADFTKAEIISIYVFDEFDSGTSSLLKGRNARQWLFSHGAKVYPLNDLNPFMGMPWYESAREVTRTLEHRIAGTHQDVSLSKGTRKEYRLFAREFVSFLMAKKILKKIVKSKTGPGYVIKVNPDNRQLIHDFSREGKISSKIKPFFDKYIPEELRTKT